MKNIPRLFVRYYKSDFPAAQPPFIEGKPKSFSFKPDSVFFIEMDEGQSAPLYMPKNGIYHIQPDTTGKDGFTFFSFYKGFPDVTTPYQMLNALRYITSKTEYNDMSLMKNRKQAVDDFWLDVAGNPERAKEMIRKYYGRVTGANRYFTSYQEGWKTDRGMIFIVFGPPGLVYRNPDSETWIYGEDRNMMSITFNFSRVNNVFSDNDFELNRSQEYKELWYSALEGWRN
jgi:GWxTD domain-containing protein